MVCTLLSATGDIQFRREWSLLPHRPRKKMRYRASSADNIAIIPVESGRRHTNFRKEAKQKTHHALELFVLPEACRVYAQDLDLRRAMVVSVLNAFGY